MRAIQVVYLVLAVLGIVVPWYFNLQFAQQNDGISLSAFFASAMNGGPAAASLTVDIAIVFVVFAVWCVSEARSLGMKHSWFYLVWGMLVALASAFPLFLFMRDRHLQRQQALSDS